MHFFRGNTEIQILDSHPQVKYRLKVVVGDDSERIKASPEPPSLLMRQNLGKKLLLSVSPRLFEEFVLWPIQLTRCVPSGRVKEGVANSRVLRIFPNYTTEELGLACSRYESKRL